LSWDDPPVELVGYHNVAALVDLNSASQPDLNALSDGIGEVRSKMATQ
jgi:hypothetical protein